MAIGTSGRIRLRAAAPAPPAGYCTRPANRRAEPICLNRRVVHSRCEPADVRYRRLARRRRRRRPARRRDPGRDPPSRARRRGGAPVRERPAPAHAAADHRPFAGGRPADGERGRLGLDGLQRRDLQPPASCAASSRRGATSSAAPSDTEVLPHLYEEHGAEHVRAAAGDVRGRDPRQRRRRLLLARDRFGIKPLFYGRVGDRSAFASELNALRLVPGLDLTPDRQAIADFAALLFVPAPLTIYRGARALEPATLLDAELDGGEVTRRRAVATTCRSRSHRTWPRLGARRARTGCRAGGGTPARERRPARRSPLRRDRLVARQRRRPARRRSTSSRSTFAPRIPTTTRPGRPQRSRPASARAPDARDGVPRRRLGHVTALLSTPGSRSPTRRSSASRGVARDAEPCDGRALG